MLRRTVWSLLIVFGITAGWRMVPAHSQSPPQEKGKSDFFGDTKIYKIAITIPADEYKAIQPQGGFGPGGFGGFPGAPQKAPEKVADDREVHLNNFGLKLPLAHGAVVVDGQKFDKVGIRYKGNGTIMDASNTIKKSFKIDLARYDDKLRFHGLKTLNMSSAVADPSKARETLGYAAYRRAGVPAPRTALAEVTLTVPGKYDREYLGLYTLLESVDKEFLKAHYKTDAGLLFKPEKSGGLNYFGEDWEKYKEAYQPKRDATPEEQKRFIAFVKLIHLASDEDFKKNIESFIDVDAFLRFMSTTALVVNLDSFFVLGHNVLLYLHPDTHKFHFIPWDLDRGFANFPIFGSPEQQMDLSIVKPYMQCRLPDRLLKFKEYRDRHNEILREVAATFTKEQLLGDIETFELATKAIIDKGTKSAADRNEVGGGPFGPGPGGPFGQQAPGLRTFVLARTKSIDAQLAGKSEGYAMQMGGFGPPDMGGPGGGPGGMLAKPLFDSLDTKKSGKVTEAEFAEGMKKLFTEWDKDKSGSIDQRELAQGLQRLIPGPQMGPMGGGPPGGFPGGPGKGPGGFPGPQPKGP